MNHPRQGVSIVGSGSAIVSQTLANEALSRLVETSDDWIQSRTGIRQRRLLPPETSLAELAAAAGREALANAGVDPLAVDLILLATSTPDDLFGSAGKIQHLLGAERAVAFDLTAACSGFVFALVTGAQFIRAGAYRTVLVIGADILSRWLDWSDRTTCVLFGDGAGAAVLQVSDRDNLLAFELCSDGAQGEALSLRYQGRPQILGEGAVISQGAYQPIAMKGKEVYRFAVARAPEIVEKVCFQAGVKPEELDWLALHQANQRILDAVGERLGIPPEKILSNLAQYGNTSAASIPLVLDEAVAAGKIQPGNLIALAGFGAGLSWGGAIIRWG
ncbi:MAG: beta-ketoacyl-ACP synthase III [Cyanobacteria bacterium RI_101]|nr:beta-ketoacyl-ACP synthase III [Cyanobacteria bacterium RI_101]